jgi:surfeit locus 1 family protein
VIVGRFAHPRPARVVVLIGLGTWQLQRKAWKEGLIAALDAQLAAPPIALPAAAA